MLNIDKHTIFTRVSGSLDLETYLDISLKEALTGFNREILLLNSDELVKIECNSVVNPYDSKTISEYGMQKYTKSGSLDKKGNLIIKFKIQFPVIISEDTKNIVLNLNFE